MATLTLSNFIGQKTMNGLNTYQVPIATAGMHAMRIQVSHHSPSNLTASIVQAGSVDATLATVTVLPVTLPNNDARSSAILTAIANCQPGDTISFVITSSSPNDQQLNNVKSDMTISQGQIP